MTLTDRIAALVAAGSLTAEQQARAVELGLLPAAAASPEAQTQATNADALRTKARAAITANDAFLALASPTNAQTLAQVRALTRETTALIRLAVKALDTTSGT